MNNSASGGYVQPIQTQPLPKQLTLNQFIQTVLVGVSALPGESIRPKWQVAPAKQPDLGTNWAAFGVNIVNSDIYSFVGMNKDGADISQRQEGLEVGCSFYGPDALEIASLVRDGFQIQQNLEALRAANMGFVECGPMMHLPELVNERFINRIEMGVFLRRQVQRVYPILSILSASGAIHTVLGDEPYLIDWKTTT